MEQKLSLFIESIKDAVVVIDDHGKMQMVNEAVETMLGYTPKELIGENVSKLMPPPHQANHDQYIENHQKTGKAKIIGIGREVIAVRKDGKKVPVRLNISELNLDGQHFYVGMLHDLTKQRSIDEHISKVNTGLEEELQERNQELQETVRQLTKSKLDLEHEILERRLAEEKLKLAQEEIQKALDKERELNELKSRFISTASHEFRTPLSSILSSASLIERYTTTETNDKRNKHINRIKSSVQNLTQILNDFLSLSKLEEGRVEQKKHIFDLCSVIEAVKEEVSVSAKKGQTIHYNHEGEVSVIYSNLQSIKNVLINLCSNAIKYSGEGKDIYITSKIKETEIEISVIDEGIGIPEHQKHFMFERFFRADNATNIQGTGLGLYIVKKYLENLDGEITFESKLGEGTTFTFSFPKEQPQ